MRRRFAAVLSASAFIAILGSCATNTAPERSTGLVDRAIQALGGAEALGRIQTVHVKGTAKQWEPEQSEIPGGEMRFANQTTFEVWQDRAQRASRSDIVRAFAYPSPRTFTFSEIVTPEAGYVLGIDSNGRNAESLKANPPAHSMSSLRLAAAQREGLRASPSALLLAMHASPERVQAAPDVAAGGASYPAVAYDGPNGVRFIVAFDPATGLPARVRTLDYDNIWGDVNYDVAFGGWIELNGVKVPMSRRYELSSPEGGSVKPITDVTFTELQFNAPADASRFAIPEAVRASAAKPASGGAVPYQWVIRRQIIGTYLDSENLSYDSKGPGLRLQEVGKGIYHAVGGSHNSLIVEMGTHLVVFDAPVSDWQSKWLLEAAKKQFPGKPVRYLVLTHHHMDHAGGLRAYAAEGATLIVGPGAAGHFRQVLAAPWTRNPDLKARDLTHTRIVEVQDKYVLADGGREVQVLPLENPHARGMLIGYVPDAKLGFVTDIWSPGPPLPPKPNPGLLSVVNAVRKYGIQPERFAGGHGGVADYAPLARLAGQ